MGRDDMLPQSGREDVASDGARQSQPDNTANDRIAQLNTFAQMDLGKSDEALYKHFEGLGTMRAVEYVSREVANADDVQKAISVLRGYKRGDIQPMTKLDGF